jgi:hypothetical protein
VKEALQKPPPPEQKPIDYPSGIPASINTSMITDAEYTAFFEGFQIQTFPIIAGADGRFPAMDVKLNGC